MENKYYLPGLYDDKKSSSEGVDGIDSDLTPLISQFINEPECFFLDNFDNLNTYKLREKRFIQFETPNRALITHEYDLQIEDDFNYNQFYYLFNPFNRLSCLKISQEGKRLSVAKESKVKEIVKSVLKDELTKCSLKFDDLWEKKKGLPCFIKLEDTKYNDFLLSASYYDSIKEISGNKKCSILQMINPLTTRDIEYVYLPLIKKSSWLYITAPKSFEIEYINKKNENDKINKIEGYNQTAKESADPGITSLTIINRAINNENNKSVNINFKIKVPKSLKVWFLSIYYLAVGVLGILLATIINEIWLYFRAPILNISSPLEIFFSKNNFGMVIMGVIAAVITTRGWIITEETITKYYSIYLTTLMVTILTLFLIIMLI